MPCRRGRDGGELLAWQDEVNTVPKKVHATIEHAFARLKWWNILRNGCRERDGVYHATRRYRTHAQPGDDQLSGRTLGGGAPGQHFMAASRLNVDGRGRKRNVDIRRLCPHACLHRGTASRLLV
ncbi:hypothetical protein GCM10010411_66500 [Actinomadura fulvescens]|uniref:Transposase n=1 Tax=Actinomadura fulvescens TaxID=46160 RepID=A0ABP6CN94_9ACTN